MVVEATNHTTDLPKVAGQRLSVQNCCSMSRAPKGVGLTLLLLAAEARLPAGSANCAQRASALPLPVTYGSPPSLSPPPSVMPDPAGHGDRWRPLRSYS